MCSANVSVNYKDKFVVIGKAKMPWLFKDTEAVGLPIHCYSHIEAWVDKDIFENWFHRKFVPETRYFRKEKALSQKAVLLLYNVHPYPSTVYG
jgi:hypothetical protein